MGPKETDVNNDTQKRVRPPTVEKNQRRSQGVQMKQIQDDNLRKLRTQNPPETVHGGETTQTRTGLQEQDSAAAEPPPA